MKRVSILVMALLITGCVTTRGDDPVELERTWQGSRLYIPSTPGASGRMAGFGRLDAMETRIAKLGTAPRYPVVVYLHGCAGRGVAARTTGEFLATAGYLVVQPDSFARENKPISCDPRTHTGGMHREAVTWRQWEAAHAVKRLRQWPFVDGRNIFILGFSEGGMTAATLTGVNIRGRIIEGWTCKAGWPEYDGLRAPASQPVLALLGKRDPWFAGKQWVDGDCSHLVNKTNASASHVFDGPLATSHHLLAYPEVQKLVSDFLARHRAR